MARDQFLLARGLREALPNLALAEPAYLTDTEDLVIGGNAGNVNLSNKNSINVKSFGCIGDGVTDDTTAFQNAINEAVAKNKMLFIPSGVFKITSNLIVNSNGFTMQGVNTNDSVILFDETNGFLITQTTEGASINIKNICFSLTYISYNNYVAINYTGSPSTGDVTNKIIEDCLFIGEDRRNLTSPYNITWYRCMQVNEGDRFVVNNCRFQGAQEELNVFNHPTQALYITNSTHFNLTNSHILIYNEGVYLEGLSENFFSNNNTIIGCKIGINLQPNTSPANDHNIVNTHVSAYEVNIKMSTDVGTDMETLALTISSCFFLKRDDSLLNFKHIEINGIYFHISNNLFFTIGAINTINDVGIDIISSKKGLIYGNTFFNQYTGIKIDANSINLGIQCNMIVDTPSSQLGEFILDSGAFGLIVLNNTGDRNTDFLKSPYDELYKALSHSFYTGSDNLALNIINGAATVENYIDIFGGGAGDPVNLRASGSDADIDFRIYSKGANGRVRFGTHNTTTDAAITGYIEIKDINGTIRKLAIID